MVWPTNDASVESYKDGWMDGWMGFLIDEPLDQLCDAFMRELRSKLQPHLLA